MTFLTPAQFFQLGRKCSLCEDKAKWFKWVDKFDENAPAYCDKHYPGRSCDCEICKNLSQDVK